MGMDRICSWFGKMGDRYHALKVTQINMIHVMRCISMDVLTCLNDA